MGSNEISNIARQQLRQKQEAQGTEQRPSEQPTIEVFSSNHVAARVDLSATEQNRSVFENTNLHAVAGNAAMLTDDAVTGTPTASETEDAPITLTDDEQKTINAKFKDAKPEVLEALNKLSPAQLKEVAKLSATTLAQNNIIQIARIFKPEGVDTIISRVQEIEELAGGKDNVYMSALGNDFYDNESFVVRSLDNNKTMRSTILDENLKVRSIEQVGEKTNTDGVTYREQEAYDLKTNTLSKIRFDQQIEEIDGKKVVSYVASYEIRSKMDENDNMVSREYTKKSKVPGMYDVSILTEDGETDVSKTKQRKSGKTIVKRDVTSPDGTRTQYKFKENKDGDRTSRYKITDKDGNVLMNNKKTFEVVDKNTFKSTFNGKSYTMKVDGDILTVQNDADENDNAKFDLSTIEGNKDSLANILKRMSGDQLIALSKTTDKLVGIDKVIESYYKTLDRSIHSGDDMFVVLHEEGHSKDFQTLNMFDGKTEASMISRDKELTETFEAEKKAFFEAFPDAQREHVDYFTNIVTHYGGANGGLQETVAESNAILETPKSHDMLGLRSQYLQQYFPRTIARLNTLLGENRERVDHKMELFKLEIPELKIPVPQLPKMPIPGQKADE